MKRMRRKKCTKQNEKSEILGERGKRWFLCVLCVLFVSVTAEVDAISLSLSSLFFREEYVCARTRILSEKKGGNRLKRNN